MRTSALHELESGCGVGMDHGKLYDLPLALRFNLGLTDMKPCTLRLAYSNLESAITRLRLRDQAAVRARLNMAPMADARLIEDRPLIPRAAKRFVASKVPWSIGVLGRLAEIIIEGPEINRDAITGSHNFIPTQRSRKTIQRVS